MTATHRSIEEIVRDQAALWVMRNKERRTTKEKPRPLVTISREPGSAGVGDREAPRAGARVRIS
ncbi:MAG: hypothetical protein M5R36_26835 [Deltaproteobacteria bacterium]|nr:hypothetical protein [Deltaproteobacteria bacterium]